MEQARAIGGPAVGPAARGPEVLPGRPSDSRTRLRFPVDAANFRGLNPLYETVTHQFSKPGERHPENGAIPALSANTLGEVMDGLWFENRHARQRLSAKELLEGSVRGEAPSVQQKWRVLTVRKYGIRPGLLIHDAKNQLYLLRFDPPERLEMSTGAAMIGSRIFHALGYVVAEHHLVYFDRAQLVADPEGEDINAVGRKKSRSRKKPLTFF